MASVSVSRHAHCLQFILVIAALPMLAALVVPSATARRHCLRPRTGHAVVRAEGGDPRGALVDGPPLRVEELSPKPDVETLFQVYTRIPQALLVHSARHPVAS